MERYGKWRQKVSINAVLQAMCQSGLEVKGFLSFAHILLTVEVSPKIEYSFRFDILR